MTSGGTPARVRPTPALLACLATAGALHELSRETGGGWLAVFSALLLTLPVVSYALRPRLVDLTVERVVRGQPAVGTGTDTVLRVRNRGRQPVGRFVVEDELFGHPTVRVAFGGLAAGDVAEVSVPRVATRRGVGKAGVLRLVAPAPFGCLQVRTEREQDAMLTVHPQVLAAPETLARTVGRSTGQAGHGTDVLGLRDWRPGEAVTTISARATARHGRPVLLEREREQPPGLVVLVTAGEGPLWERAVSQAAGLLLDELGAGRTPVLLGFAAGSPSTRTGLLDRLAGADDAAVFSTGLVQQARRRAGGGALALVADGVPCADPGVVVLG